MKVAIVANAIAFIRTTDHSHRRYALPPKHSPPRTLYSTPMNIPGAQSRIAFTAIEQQISSQQQQSNGQLCRTSTPHTTIANARDHIFQLGAVVGQMFTLFLSVPHDSIEFAERPSLDDDPFWLEPSGEKEKVANQLGEVFLQLFAAAAVCGIDLCDSILKKVELNGRKYPVDLCKVRCHDK